MTDRLRLTSTIVGVSAVGMALGFGLQFLSTRFLAFIVLAAAGGFLILLPIRWCILLYFLYVGVEGCAKLLTNYNPIVHIGSDLLIGILWVKAAFLLIRTPPSERPEWPPLSSLFIVHLVWFGITVLNPYSLSLFASLAGAKLYVTIISLYFFGYFLASDARSIDFFFVPWALITILQIVTGLYQASVGPDSVTSLSYSYVVALKKYEGYAFRPFGLGSQPGIPAIFIYIAIPIFLHFIFASTTPFLLRIALIGLLPACVATLLFCQIRSAILKAILGAGAYIFATLFQNKSITRQARNRTIAGVTFVSLILLLLTPNLTSRVANQNADTSRAIERSLTLFNYDSISHARGGALDRLVDYALQVPFGAGLSRVGSAAGKFQELLAMNQYFSGGFFTDNLWVEIVVDLGIPGLIILTTIFFLILFKGAVGFRVDLGPELQSVHATIFVILFVILLGGYGAEPILYNPEGGIFWFLSGVLVKITAPFQTRRTL